MAATFEQFDYRLRPAKSVERKMMCDAFRRLAPFGSVDRYQYVGFGANSFVDFILLHRSLGIKKMVSMEARKDLEKRVLFNRPFRCIHVEFESSAKALPKLDWKTPSIVWLDYDKALNGPMLGDVSLVATKVVPGSFICFSVAAGSGDDDDTDDETANDDGVESEAERMLRKIQRRLPLKVPLDVTHRSLKGWGTAEVYRRIITNEIESALAQRNSLLRGKEKFEYRQFFNFHYADGAKMMTCGGLIVRQSQIPLVKQCDFGDLDFTRTRKQPYHIEIPILTHREMRYLDTKLPRPPRKRVSLPGVKPEEVQRYSHLYRYLHPFAETEL